MALKNEIDNKLGAVLNLHIYFKSMKGNKYFNLTQNQLFHLEDIITQCRNLATQIDKFKNDEKYEGKF